MQPIRLGLSHCQTEKFTKQSKEICMLSFLYGLTYISCHYPCICMCQTSLSKKTSFFILKLHLTYTFYYLHNNNIPPIGKTGNFISILNFCCNPHCLFCYWKSSVGTFPNIEIKTWESVADSKRKEKKKASPRRNPEIECSLKGEREGMGFQEVSLGLKIS